MFPAFFFYFFLLFFGLKAQDADNKFKLCEHCRCSDVPDENGSYYRLDIMCSDFDRIVNFPDLDKIEWPDNPRGLIISASFEELEISTLGKVSPSKVVESLRFSSNAIKAYWPDPFSDVPYLKQLSLTHNEFPSITPDLFTGLKKLEKLDLSFNRIESLTSLDFAVLAKLTELNLSGNLFKDIPLSALQSVPNLESLDLSKNGIYDLALKTEIASLRNLKRLYISGNKIITVLKDSFQEDNLIEYVDLSNNLLHNVEEETFSTCEHLKELNLGHNNISTDFSLPPFLEIAIFKYNALEHWPVFPTTIKYIDMSYNALKDMYDDSTNKFDGLETLNIAGNKISSFNIKTKLPSLINLDLSYNKFESIPSVYLELFPRLEELKLDGNPIINVHFPNVLSLRRLYMNDLDVTSIGEGAFGKIKGKDLNDVGDPCFELHISACSSLADIQDGAFDGTSVCMLDISHNNLTSIPESLLDWSMVKNGVDLQGNPWECSCRMQWMLNKLIPILYKKHSRLLTELRCGYPRGFSGLRMVHWYNWTGQVLCREEEMSRRNGYYMLEPSTEGEPRSMFYSISYMTIALVAGILICSIIAIVLTVYLIVTRKRYRIRLAAMKRKRQSALDAKLAAENQKEPFSALNKVY